MVGDSVDRSTNESVQFVRFTGDVHQDAVVHYDGSYRLFKVDPVTFPGFKPVALNKNRTLIQLGLNLTVVSYGPANSTVEYSYANLTWPGQALEGSLNVTQIENPNERFWAGHNDVGVCVGESISLVEPSRAESHWSHWCERLDSRCVRRFRC
jgi:hypothetical protein